MKKFVKIICLVMIVCMMAGTLLLTTGCNDTRERLYVFNCNDYIEKSVISQFEKEYNIKVVYEVYDTNEQMYQKLIKGNIAYDVIFPSDYMIEQLINEDRLLKMDLTQISNYQYIGEQFKGKEFDPNNEYTVPYMWGTLGILYNKTKVNKEVKHWDILWDEDYKNQILMLDSVRDTMGIALKKCGFSMNSRTKTEIDMAGNALTAQKKLVAKYGVDELKDLMINGSYSLSVAWSGDAVWMQMENPDLEYVIPEEGSNVWVDAMVMPKTGKNQEAAYKFIDFMCRTDIAQKNAEYIGYSTAQTEAMNIVEDDDGNLLKDNPIYNPSSEILERCEISSD